MKSLFLDLNFLAVSTAFLYPFLSKTTFKDFAENDIPKPCLIEFFSYFFKDKDRCQSES
ncbi:hypothetical protein [Chryseobacterium sp. 18068]|uniref:hypothetical protein n=1 Tax=Chryseobacterium sp. 18068 TaxID=2681414 RepID=UPI001358C283|nr:hypothetical protein [Chryseobacterium sp. 18068]